MECFNQAPIYSLGILQIEVKSSSMLVMSKKRVLVRKFKWKPTYTLAGLYEILECFQKYSSVWLKIQIFKQLLKIIECFLKYSSVFAKIGKIDYFNYINIYNILLFYELKI